jgi:hypothetical protein
VNRIKTCETKPNGFIARLKYLSLICSGSVPM